MRCYLPLASLLLTAVLTGCGLPANVVVLIPDQDGHVGAAAITNPGGTARLDGSFASVGAPSGARLSKTFVADRADVDSEFRGVLSATPRAPVSFTISFLSGQAEIAPGSQAVLDDAVAKARSTPNADIGIIGHSDQTGTVASNLELSLRRATLVRDRMVAAGIAGDIIELAYHGANNPAVKTAAGVAEARNRRVEITIR